MKTPLKVLIVEDSEFDARILINVLRKGGYEPTFLRVETAEAMAEALKADQWQVVLADYNLPTFSAPAALRLLQESGIDLPFIIISGGIGEDTAVAAMKAGAHDYLMKGNLARLVPAVERELREAVTRAARRVAEQSLRESELRYRLLWETATDAVVLMDMDSIIHFANPAVEAVFGYKPEEVVGQSLALLQPAHLRMAHERGLKHYLATGEKHVNWRATETVGRRKDGTEIAIEVAFSDMEFQDKRQFVGFIRDISERKRTERELREHEEQFRVAREIQERLFPTSSPSLTGVDIAGASHPAEAAGGDYFDYFTMMDGRQGIVVGDVTGHGVGPALLMAETRAYLRLLARNRSDVGEILTLANQVLAEDVGSERFVTLFLATLDPATRRLAYASAGHPAGYVIGTAGQVRAVLKRTGIPLGIRANTEYKSALPLALEAGDVVLFLTDGIEETMAPDNSFFGEERIIEVVRTTRHLTAGEVVASLYLAVREFARNEPQADDFTAVVIKVL